MILWNQYNQNLGFKKEEKKRMENIHEVSSNDKLKSADLYMSTVECHNKDHGTHKNLPCIFRFLGISG